MKTNRASLLLIVLALVTAAACSQNTPQVTPPPTLLPPTLTLAPAASAPPESSGGVIAYASLESSDWQIYTVNADGSGQRQVTVDIKGGYEPNWSPDGTQIVFQ